MVAFLLEKRALLHRVLCAESQRRYVQETANCTVAGRILVLLDCVQEEKGNSVLCGGAESGKLRESRVQRRIAAV